MKKLIITEKPSVAMEIAKVLNVKQRADGYMYNPQDSTYTVSWAVGHLVSLAEPKVYNENYSKWSLADLPIIPNKFQYEINPKTKKQFNILKEQISKVDSIICATDAGREGELIFRLIYKLIGQGRPVQRLWISSLTTQAIKQGFASLKPISAYNNLYAAALGRNVADWLVGINSTRALSVKAGNNTLFSIGRVQTPTLRLIVERYLQHINFKPELFFQPELILNYDDQYFKAVYFERISDRVGAEQLIKSIEDIKETPLLKAEKKERKEQTPLLYDLTGLQKKASNLFGYSAKNTLDIAQRLYEKKLISYPRTDSKYLTNDMSPDMREILINVGTGDLESGFNALHLDSLDYSKRYFNNNKVSDHHAIIPTNQPANGLNEAESNIYKLVASSLIMAFSEPCIKLDTVYHFEPNGHKFLSKGTVILKKGWRLAEIFNQGEKENQLPEIAEKEIVKIDAIENKDKLTKAPPLLTAATLLALMENAGKLVEKDIEEIINKFGIGTPATRAGIIELLFNRGYIFNKGKSLVPTDRGIMIYQLTKHLNISNVEMTGQWEYKLKQIEAGEQTPIIFKAEIERYTKEIVAQIKTMKVERTDLEQCPKCKEKSLLDKSKLLSCTANNCDFILWKTIAKKKLTESQIKQLLTKGLTKKIKGFKSNAGKKFDAVLSIDTAFKVSFVFEKSAK